MMYTLPKDELRAEEIKARKNPRVNNPKKSAFGTVAERFLAKHFFDAVGHGTFVRSGKPLPPNLYSQFGHDGVILDEDGTILFVLEVKVLFQDNFSITQREYTVAEWCLETGIPYVMFLANPISDNVVSPRGMFIMTKDIYAMGQIKEDNGRLRKMFNVNSIALQEL